LRLGLTIIRRRKCVLIVIVQKRNKLIIGNLLFLLASLLRWKHLGKYRKFFPVLLIPDNKAFGEKP